MTKTAPTMHKLDEYAVEQYAIDLLKDNGFESINTVSPSVHLRDQCEEIILIDFLRNAITRINPDLPQAAIEEVLQTVLNIQATSFNLIEANKTFHDMLTHGIPISYMNTDHQEQDDLAYLVDFDKPDNNEYKIFDQFTVKQGEQTKRLDLVLFINGLPLVIMELKNPASENATLQSAYKQLQTYKQHISSIFVYNSLLVISDGLTAKAGSLTADFARFMEWKSETVNIKGELPVLIIALLNKTTLLDLIRHFTTFENASTTDHKTGIIRQTWHKKIAAYHQYYAVNKLVTSVIKAADTKSRKGGVMWHTQGSGKSLSMVFAVAKLILAKQMQNPTVVILTDRNDLDNQLFDTFAASKTLLRQEPKQAQNRKSLQTLLDIASGDIIFTTLQKFQPEKDKSYPRLSDRDNIIVLADEAHRSQYGFNAKLVDETDPNGQVIGRKTVYGFAKHLRDALPNATYLGFTGTPIAMQGRNTQNVFGDYVDIYDIGQSIEDGATVKIFYESRLAKISLSKEGRELIKTLDDSLDENNASFEEKNKNKLTQLKTLVGHPTRLAHIADDIVSPF